MFMAIFNFIVSGLFGAFTVWACINLSSATFLADLPFVPILNLLGLWGQGTLIGCAIGGGLATLNFLISGINALLKHKQAKLKQQASSSVPVAIKESSEPAIKSYRIRVGSVLGENADGDDIQPILARFYNTDPEITLKQYGNKIYVYADRVHIGYVASTSLDLLLDNMDSVDSIEDFEIEENSGLYSATFKVIMF